MAVIRAKNQLGFGMPNFQSPAKGTGVRFGRYVPPRSRLVRFRGLGDSYYPYDQEFGEYPASVPYSTSIPGVPAGAALTWGVPAPGSSVTYVPASTGGNTAIDTQWLRDLAEVARVAGQAVAQQRIISLNEERARQGLPMVDPRYLSPSAALNFGVTPQMQQMLIVGGIGLAAVLLLSRRKK